MTIKQALTDYSFLRFEVIFSLTSYPYSSLRLRDWLIRHSYPLTPEAIQGFYAPSLVPLRPDCFLFWLLLMGAVYFSTKSRINLFRKDAFIVAENTTSLQVFSNQHFKVRIINQDGEPWFIAKDVCDILGYANARKALNDHLDDDEKGVTICDTPGGNQNMNIINESGLYALVLRSNMPKAKEFRKWVTGEVLPSIRKTGQYVSSLTVDEFELKRKDLDLRGAQILQSLIDKELFPLTPETRTVFAHEVFRLVTGHNYLAMLPESNDKWFTASDIGKELGISANMVGRIAKKEGIKPPEGESNEFGRWIFSKSRYSSREVPSFIYNEFALDWFKNHLAQSA